MNKKLVISIVILGLCILGTHFVGIGVAADRDLAEQYAPILYFVDGEQCYPVDVSYAIENSYLYEVDNPTPVSTSPTEIQLQNYTSDLYYLDNQRGTTAVGDNGIESDYQSKLPSLGYTVYSRVETTQNVIQYWLFYAFNGGDLNRHEGDWEMVQVILAGEQPVEVMFSQHYSGQKATWSQVEKEGNHVKVYVARGSHANYIKPFSGKLGLASDVVGDNGKVLKPKSLQSDGYGIILLGSQPWLSFAGRWGWAGASQAAAAEAQLLGETGPNGPMFREGGTMWQPQTWAAGLQPANDVLFILEWCIYNFVLLFILLTVVSLLLLVFFILRRKKKYGLGPRVFSLLYIDGVNQQSIGNILCIVSVVLAILGLLFPWYIVTANISIPSYPQSGTFNAVSVDGFNGIQVRLPNRSGPVPLGTVAMPFYIIILVGVIFIILSTIGVYESKKLGKKYLFRGIRLMVPFLLILIFIMAVASIIPLLLPSGMTDTVGVRDVMQRISASPFSGQQTIQGLDVNGGSVSLAWGFGVGAYLLLFSSIVLMMAGIIELTAHATFFEPKTSVESLKKPEQKAEPEEKKP
jgi:hypothetical protein